MPLGIVPTGAAATPGAPGSVVPATGTATPSTAGVVVAPADPASTTVAAPGAVTPVNPATPRTVITAADDLLTIAAALNDSQKTTLRGELGLPSNLATLNTAQTHTAVQTHTADIRVINSPTDPNALLPKRILDDSYAMDKVLYNPVSDYLAGLNERKKIRLGVKAQSYGYTMRVAFALDILHRQALGGYVHYGSFLIEAFKSYGAAAQFKITPLGFCAGIGATTVTGAEATDYSYLDIHYLQTGFHSIAPDTLQARVTQVSNELGLHKFSNITVSLLEEDHPDFIGLTGAPANAHIVPSPSHIYTPTA